MKPMIDKGQAIQHLEVLCYAIEKYTDRDKFEPMHLNLAGIAEAIKDIPIYKYSKRERRALDNFESVWRQHIKS